MVLSERYTLVQDTGYLCGNIFDFTSKPLTLSEAMLERTLSCRCWSCSSPSLATGIEGTPTNIPKTSPTIKAETLTSANNVTRPNKLHPPSFTRCLRSSASPNSDGVDTPRFRTTESVMASCVRYHLHRRKESDLGFRWLFWRGIPAQIPAKRMLPRTYETGEIVFLRFSFVLRAIKATTRS